MYEEELPVVKGGERRATWDFSGNPYYASFLSPLHIFLEKRKGKDSGRGVR